jgi:hypothetical protein
LGAEYFQYLDNNCFGNGATPAKVIQMTDPLSIFHLPFQNIKQSLPYFVNASYIKIKNSITRTDTTDPQRSYFNEDGDFTGHLLLSNREPKILSKYLLNGEIKKHTFKLIKDYQKKIEEKNCKFFITYPTFPKRCCYIKYEDHTSH